MADIPPFLEPLDDSVSDSIAALSPQALLGNQTAPAATPPPSTPPATAPVLEDNEVDDILDQPLKLPTNWPLRLPTQEDLAAPPPLPFVPGMPPAPTEDEVIEAPAAPVEGSMAAQSVAVDSSSPLSEDLDDAEPTREVPSLGDGAVLSTEPGAVAEVPFGLEQPVVADSLPATEAPSKGSPFSAGLAERLSAVDAAPTDSPVAPDTVLPFGYEEPKKSSRRPLLIAGLVGGIAVILVPLVGFAFAMMGGRVPVFYKTVTALSTDGVAQAAASRSLVAKRTSYSYASVDDALPTITLTSQGAASTSTEGDGLSDSASPIDYKTTFSSGIQSVATDAFTGAARMVVGSSSEVPFQIGTKRGTSNTGTLVRLLTTDPITFAEVAARPIAQTVLQPLLQPLSLDQILGAVSSETDYQAQRSQRQSTYIYALNPTGLSSAFPVGATIENAQAAVGYGWGTGLPRLARVVATMIFEGQRYQYTQTYGVSETWDEQIGGELTSLAAGSEANAKPLPFRSFITLLGLESDGVPGLAAARELDPYGRATLSPQGRSTKVLLPEITATPELPALTASSVMKARDAERIRDLTLLATALQSYAEEHDGAYPVVSQITQAQTSETLLSALVPQYISALPIDPLSSFWYEYSGSATGFILRAVAEDRSSALARKGVAFSYYEFTEDTVITTTPAEDAGSSL